FQAEDGIRYATVTGVQTCALSISLVWLQFDGVKLKPHNNLPKYGLHPYVSSWSLHYLTLQQQQQIVLGIPAASEVLLKGTFDQRSEERRVGKSIRLHVDRSIAEQR